ncbi:acyl-coenzyme A diphosphatase FITM2 isoform X1 [Columba livia]|uniref:acyl-coenzyme A diphosphatase FITM2 isoform X1 n=1 Tax=Columba livia TaxID=8932 RepID=UPI0031BAAEDA
MDPVRTPHGHGTAHTAHPHRTLQGAPSLPRHACAHPPPSSPRPSLAGATRGRPSAEAVAAGGAGARCVTQYGARAGGAVVAAGRGGGGGGDGAAGALRPRAAGRAGRRAGAPAPALAAARHRAPRVRPQGWRPGARDAHAEQAQPAQRVRRGGGGGTGGGLDGGYFVKVAWAWTFWLLLPFIAVTTYQFAGSKFLYGPTKSVLMVLRRLSALLVGTAIWYVCTGLFIYIENLTGVCSTSGELREPRRLYATKQECHQDNGIWNGFDISGHCFLLSYCALMIMEEVAVLEGLSIDQNSKLHVVINVLFVSLCFLTMIWVFMFLCTALYFHDFSQKILGVLIGLSAWYGTYRCWYLKPFSPGLPLPSIPLSSKKYSYSR